MPLTIDECRTRVTEAINKYQPKIAEHIGSDGLTFDVDWDSFEDANNPGRVYRHLTSWTGYYTFGYVNDAIRKVCNEYDGATALQSLDKIIFRHVNDGVDREDRVRVEDDNLIIEASCCCYYHWVYRSDITVALVIHFELFDGYITKINEAAQDASEAYANIPMETDFDTFDFSEVAENDFEAKKMKANALKNAATYSGWYSWRSVRWAAGWYYADYTDEEKTNAFSKFVLSNKMWQPPPDENTYWGYDQSEVKYLISSKELHIKNCYGARRYYWNYAGSYDVRRVVNQVLRLMRLGQFEELDEEGHDEKIDFLRSICTSWEVMRGDFEWLKKVVNFPAFYPKDQHERNAAKILVDFVNTEDYRKKFIMEDTLEEETEQLRSTGYDPDKPEELIGGWLVTKINWKGMKQDRLVVVTDRATYTCVPKYKGKANKKKIHRISHLHYSYIQVGELKTKTGGAPSVTGGALPGDVNLPDLPDINTPDLPDVNMPDVNMPDGPDVNMPGMPGRGGFRGPPHALKLYSSRLRKDEKPPKKISIPDLPAKLCAAMESMIEAIKDIDMPSMPTPSRPKLTCPDLLDLFSKMRPGGDDDDEGGAGAGTVRNPNACAADMPEPSEASTQLGVISSKLREVDGAEDPEVEEGEAGVPGMLTKCVNKIKGLGDIELTLPGSLTLVGIIGCLKKAVPSGLSVPLPQRPALTPRKCIQKIIDTLEGKSVPDMPPPFNGTLLTALEGLRDSCEEGVGKIPFPKPPSLGIKKVLGSCSNVLSGIDLPTPDLSGIGLPKLPGLPSAPKLPGGLPGAPKIPGLPGGGKMPGFKKGESPVKNEYIMMLVTPILPKKISGASKYVCLEMAWVIQAGVRCFRRGYASGVSGGDINVLTSFGSSLFNKIGRGVLGKGVSSKPSGEGKAEEGEEI